MSITDIEQWIDNDEGLYRWWRRSGRPKREFIKVNRQGIEEVINHVLNNEKPAHYLRYGG